MVFYSCLFLRTCRYLTTFFEGTTVQKALNYSTSLQYISRAFKRVGIIFAKKTRARRRQGATDLHNVGWCLENDMKPHLCLLHMHPRIPFTPKMATFKPIQALVSTKDPLWGCSHSSWLHRPHSRPSSSSLARHSPSRTHRCSSPVGQGRVRENQIS